MLLRREDQIVFTVPNSVPVGCAVPLAIQIGNQISNTTVMPVANGSRTCTLVNAAGAAIGTQQIEQLVTAGPVTFTSAHLDHFADGNGTFEDDAKFEFLKSTGYVLDAGSTYTVTGPKGSMTLPVNGAKAVAFNMTGAFLVPGTFTIPPYVLEALPAGTAAGVVLSYYSTASFTATGLNAGFLTIDGNDSGFGYGWGSGNFTLK
ncbi:MAG TPA: hypothetical protein VLW65_06735 [Bryobacteraceae bacterium]|nr:hypothetical protein [Bryobacteraceae bacterium]